MNTAAKEWKSYLKLFNAGASRSKLIDSAKKMKDTENRRSAMMNLGFATKAEMEKINRFWASVNAVTEKECRAHCQFDGLPVI